MECGGGTDKQKYISYAVQVLRRLGGAGGHQGLHQDGPGDPGHQAQRLPVSHVNMKDKFNYAQEIPWRINGN